VDEFIEDLVAHLAHRAEEAQAEGPRLSRRLENLDRERHPPPQAGGSKRAFHRAKLNAPREMQYRCGTIIAAHGNAYTQRNNNFRN
jgi:hypothetical protein